VQLIEDKDETSNIKVIATFQSLVKSTNDSLNGGYGEWSVSSRKSCDVIFKEPEAAGALAFASVRSSFLPPLQSQLQLFHRSTRPLKQLVLSWKPPSGSHANLWSPSASGVSSACSKGMHNAHN
jgi:hypothetical protein